MARLDARQKADKKRNGGNFKAQKATGSGNGSGKTAGVHRNKYAEFSKAAGAQDSLAARRERDAREAERRDQYTNTSSGWMRRPSW